jgi:hypothetical protein
MAKIRRYRLMTITGPESSTLNFNGASRAARDRDSLCARASERCSSSIPFDYIKFRAIYGRVVRGVGIFPIQAAIHQNFNSTFTCKNI